MKIQHIKKAQDFATVIKKGKKIRGKTVSLYVDQTNGRDELYIGVIVSKKFAPLAIRRNYIKRQIYSYFRDCARSCKCSEKIVVRLVRDIRNMNKRFLSKEIGTELKNLSKKIQTAA